MKQYFVWAAKGIVENLGIIASIIGSAFLKVLIDSGSQPLTWGKRFIKFIIAVCCGSIVSWMLFKSGRVEGAIFFGPASTLLGESLIRWVLLHTNDIYNFAFNLIKTKVKDNDKTKN